MGLLTRQHPRYRRIPVQNPFCTPGTSPPPGTGPPGDLDVAGAQLADPVRRAELDALLVVDAALGRTPLAWLGAGATTSSPAAVKTELAKLGYLRGLDADTLGLSVLPAQRRRLLAGLGHRLTAQALARRDPDAATRSC